MKDYQKDIERFEERLKPRIVKDKENREKARIESEKRIKILEDLVEQQDIKSRLDNLSEKFIEKSNKKWKKANSGIKTTFLNTNGGGIYLNQYTYVLKRKLSLFPKSIKIELRNSPHQTFRWDITTRKEVRSGEGTEELINALTFIFADEIDNRYR